jgi:hypothetical protein
MVANKRSDEVTKAASRKEIILGALKGVLIVAGMYTVLHWLCGFRILTF